MEVYSKIEECFDTMSRWSWFSGSLQRRCSSGKGFPVLKNDIVGHSSDEDIESTFRWMSKRDLKHSIQWKRIYLFHSFDLKTGWRRSMNANIASVRSLDLRNVLFHNAT